jgi:hypothetical protein
MDPLGNLRIAYRVLEDRVQTALRTQLGDAERLSGHREEAIRLVEMCEQVRAFDVPLLLLNST